MKDLMMLYGVTLGKRYLKREKDIFVEALAVYFSKLNYSVGVQGKQSPFSALNDIVIGEIKSAKKIIVAAYDTPSRVLVPNYLYYPFNMKRNMRYENLNLLIKLFASCLLAVSAFFILRGFVQYELWLKTVAILVSLLLVLITYFCLKEKGNIVNFNRNSASIAVICAAAREYKNKDVAFVLLDQCVNSYEGFKLLLEHIDAESKEILMLEALASGEELVLVNKGKTSVLSMMKNKEDLSIYEKAYDASSGGDNFMSLFPNILYFGSGSNKNKQFVIKNTRSRKDCEVDMARLETIGRVVLSYMKGGE